MLCCPEKALCFLVYTQVCVFVLLVLRSSFSGEKIFLTDSELQKVDCYLSGALRWFRRGNASVKKY